MVSRANYFFDLFKVFLIGFLACSVLANFTIIGMFALIFVISVQSYITKKITLKDKRLAYLKTTDDSEFGVIYFEELEEIDDAGNCTSITFENATVVFDMKDTKIVGVEILAHPMDSSYVVQDPDEEE